ncbi:MAG: hypothetical protein FWE32_11955 [Oscillospiraceae bacterium]|nr:hypothetical protein [Oscillospiraceae bacterium]
MPVLSAAAIACFIFFEGAAWLGTILLFLGLGLPGHQIRRFFQTLKLQIAAFGLETPTHVYTLYLSDSPGGITASYPVEDQEDLRYEWAGIHNVYLLDAAVYLYVLPDKAFLMPGGQVRPSGQALRQLLSAVVPAGRLHDRRKKK